MKITFLSLAERKNLASSLNLSSKTLLQFYRNIYLSRKVDDAEMIMKKQSKAFFQISGAGHEGILTALSFILKPSYDYFLAYYRDRALCLGLGVTPYEMLCQANGNTGDTASYGRQMPAHWGNKKLNIVSKSSCTGTQFLQACGLAEAGEYLSFLQNIGKISKKNSQSYPSFNNDEIIYVSCGDGTTSQGEFWEGLTTACVQKLPVLFLVEDNGYAISVPVNVQTPAASISKTLAHFPGLCVLEVNGNCPVESYAAGLKAEEHLRSKRGLVLLHAHVTRPYSHSLSDDHSFYRSPQELAEEQKEDVLPNFRQFLLESGISTEEDMLLLEKEIQEEVKKAQQKACETPWPLASSALDFLYSSLDSTSENFQKSPVFSGPEDIPMAGSINKVLLSEIKKNPLIRLFGQDVADFSDSKKLTSSLKGKGGVFKVTSGIQRQVLEGQVFNSPLAEANIIGRAIGMAIRGLRPIVEIQFFDYIWTAYMQLKNELATLRYRSGGSFSCPVVVRVPIGGYLQGGAIYHSQCGESLFTHIPGLRVLFPSNALEAAGLLRTAIYQEDPVLFLEHKHLYYQGYNRTADPGDSFMIPFGKLNIVQSGNDLTVITYGALVSKCLSVAKELAKEGFSIEILDLRSLNPLDEVGILESVKKTHRAIIVHEETLFSGLGGEIGMQIQEKAFEYLDAPIERVGALDCHVAYCPDLEKEILPGPEKIKTAFLKVLSY